jgi:hypothetical protein
MTLKRKKILYVFVKSHSTEPLKVSSVCKLRPKLIRKIDPRRSDSGPTVDPGVFVITHIQSCRNGAGYCILGYSCDVDKGPIL